jgi:hypothetical protein
MGAEWQVLVSFQTQPPRKLQGAFGAESNVLLPHCELGLLDEEDFVLAGEEAHEDEWIGRLALALLLTRAVLTGSNCSKTSSAMKEKRAVLGDMMVYSWDVYVNGKHFALQKAKLWEAFT